MKTNAVLTRSIYPEPVNVDWKHGVYEFGNAVTLYCNSDDPLQLRTMRELWGNFTTGSSTLEVRQWDAMPEFCAVIANTEPALVPQVAPGFEYTVRVTEHGFELAASDRVGLTHAFFTACSFSIRCVWKKVQRASGHPMFPSKIVRTLRSGGFIFASSRNEPAALGEGDQDGWVHEAYARGA
jgi:hypothetical protein